MPKDYPTIFIDFNGGNKTIFKVQDTLPLKYAGKTIRYHIYLVSYYNQSPYCYQHGVFINGATTPDRIIQNGGSCSNKQGIGTSEIETTNDFVIPSNGKVSIEVRAISFDRVVNDPKKPPSNSIEIYTPSSIKTEFVD